VFRLDRLERFALAKMFAEVPENCDAWLFGSRCDVNARGGDIDILIQADLNGTECFRLSQKLTLLFQRHCEEKIDVVVYPKHNLNAEQKAFLSVIKKIPLRPVVEAPLLDHVALLAADLRGAKAHVGGWGFAFQPEEQFDSEGTRECYVGEPARSSRILLLEAIKEGPYQRTLQKRGPGLHHIGILVFSLDAFLRSLPQTGWYVHPATSPQQKSRGTAYLFSKNVPLILEVHERPLTPPANLAPMVQKLRIKVSPEIAGSVSCMNIPELEWSTKHATAVQVSGKWESLDFLFS
jgi:methylmalonyl-CoA/ethylmalonyl-CoA epimerase